MTIYVFLIGNRQVCIPSDTLLNAYAEAKRAYPSAPNILVVKEVK